MQDDLAAFMNDNNSDDVNSIINLENKSFLISY